MTKGLTAAGSLIGVIGGKCYGRGAGMRARSAVNEGLQLNRSACLSCVKLTNLLLQLGKLHVNKHMLCCTRRQWWGNMTSLRFCMPACCNVSLKICLFSPMRSSWPSDDSFYGHPAHFCPAVSVARLCVFVYVW